MKVRNWEVDVQNYDFKNQNCNSAHKKLQGIVPVVAECETSHHQWKQMKWIVQSRELLSAPNNQEPFESLHIPKDVKSHWRSSIKKDVAKETRLNAMEKQLKFEQRSAWAE